MKALFYYLNVAVIIALQAFKFISFDTSLIVITLLWIAYFKLDKS